jgi:hypothetical protein
MPAVTDADRRAAEELRVLLADLSGFWHAPGDLGPICVAMARHREICERQLLAKLGSSVPRAAITGVAPARDLGAVRRRRRELAVYRADPV